MSEVDIEYEDLKDNIRIVFDKLGLERTKENIKLFIEIFNDIKIIFWNDIDMFIRERYDIKKENI